MINQTKKNNLYYINRDFLLPKSVAVVLAIPRTMFHGIVTVADYFFKKTPSAFMQRVDR